MSGTRKTKISYRFFLQLLRYFVNIKKINLHTNVVFSLFFGVINNLGTTKIRITKIQTKSQKFSYPFPHSYGVYFRLGSRRERSRQGDLHHDHPRITITIGEIDQPTRPIRAHIIFAVKITRSRCRRNTIYIEYNAKNNVSSNANNNNDHNKYRVK